MPMKKREQIKPAPIRENEYIKKEFVSYQEMAEHAPDWSLFCNYQLEPNGMNGQYDILKLPNMQLAFSDMHGGFMFSFEAPKNSICFSLILEVAGSACFESMKLKEGMIVVFDDREVYNFMSSGAIKIIDVSVDKDFDSPLLKVLQDTQKMYFLDDKGSLKELLLETLTLTEENNDNKKLFANYKEKIISTMEELVSRQKPQTPKCTKGEEIALQVRDKLFKHMDVVFDTEYLASEYKATTRTLQSSFKSLFGYTPQHFIRLLKLNLVHHELHESTQKETTVLAIAKKWGFMHMGRFSNYYKKLFSELPSQTLKKLDIEDDGMRLGCVEIKESI